MMWIYADPVAICFLCSVSASFFFHYHENFNLISFAPLLDCLMSFRVGRQNRYRNGISCPKSEVCCLSVSGGSILHGGGGGNEKVMRLFLPPCAAGED